MGAPQEIVQLVDHFTAHRAEFHASDYKEADACQSLIEPFFIALGWDVHNTNRHTPQEREVIPQYSLFDVEGGRKAPDYLFQVNQARKFFVEAKKPGVSIETAAAPAYQLRRYAWSAKLPVSLLTDFEELAVYDCNSRPSEKDKAATARLNFFTFEQYIDCWKDIYELFSRDAVFAGSLEKFVKDTKKGISKVDSEFLKEIEQWREILAKNFEKCNPKLAVEQLSDTVQRTIDRIIFLRMAEDRGIETYGRLEKLTKDENIYVGFMKLCQKADDKYNSGLFDFSPSGDTLTPGLKLEDKILKTILANLYFPRCPYEFSVLPAEILGNVYEQFLGKVIRITEGGRVKIEEKPEVKKAHGVYYTPSYIVDYIVKNTVGKLIEGKTPKQIASLRILDPASGSGAFLLGAYQHLLDYYLKWYTQNNPEKYSRAVRKVNDNWKLTIAEKKRILTTHLYGVDIDRQAVEVTKLSLLMKALEGENNETLGTELALFGERALPSLEQNIKCGNSLISTDYFSGQLTPDLQELKRVNPFDWEREFAEIMKEGRFNVVIGNPPYLYSAAQDNVEYFASHYQLSQYQTDYYVFFIEKALSLARPEGKVSFIVSDSWLKSEYFSKLRNHLLTKHKIEMLAVFDYPVFIGAAIENSIFIVTIFGTSNEIIVHRFNHPNAYSIVNRINANDAIQRGLIDPRLSSRAEKVIQAIERNSSRLDNMVNVNRGIHAYRTDGYGKSKFGPGPQILKDKELNSYHADTLLDETYLPELKGKDIERFTFKPAKRFLSYGPWLAEARSREFFFNPKVTLRKIMSLKLNGTFIEDPYALDQSLYILISTSNDTSELKHILGILVSRLGAWYLRTKYAIYDTLYPWYTVKQLSAFPIKKKNDRMVTLVEQMLALHKQRVQVKTDQDKTILQRQIDAIDQEIDKLVYELYGLTQDEIKLVEAVAPASSVS